MAKDVIAEIRPLDKQLKGNERQLSELLATVGTRLQNTDGIGPVLAARLIARTGRPSRFPTAAAFANYAEVAPVEIAGADKSRHRISLFGDRQLNCALHTIAMAQIRMKTSQGHVYYKRKIDEGESPREARRCLKRRLADHACRTMIASEQRQRPDRDKGFFTNTEAPHTLDNERKLRCQQRLGGLIRTYDTVAA